MEEFSTLINNTYTLDQQLRKQTSWSKKLIQIQNEVTTQILIESVEKFGIPTPPTVDIDTANKFILLLSHCTNIKFIETVLNSINLENTCLNKENIAIAYDNMLTRLGKKQRYGSCLKIITLDNGMLKSIPLPIDDEKNVDVRRSELGLKPLAEYIKHSNKILRDIHR